MEEMARAIEVERQIHADLVTAEVTAVLEKARDEAARLEEGSIEAHAEVIDMEAKWALDQARLQKAAIKQIRLCIGHRAVTEACLRCVSQWRCNEQVQGHEESKSKLIAAMMMKGGIAERTVIATKTKHYLYNWHNNKQHQSHSMSAQRYEAMVNSAEEARREADAKREEAQTEALEVISKLEGDLARHTREDIHYY